MAETAPKSLSKRGQHWLKHIEHWQSSNTTQIQYCRDQDLSVSAFRWWKRQLADGKIAKVRRQPATPKLAAALVEVANYLPSKPTEAYDYEITLPNQKQLRCRRDFDAEAVSTLLSLLEPPC